jgi:hypothetical protein
MDYRKKKASLTMTEHPSSVVTAAVFKAMRGRTEHGPTLS